MKKEEVEKTKKLNELIKAGDIQNVECYIEKNNIKIDNYFYIMSAIKNRKMLNFILDNMSKIKFRVHSKRKILDKLLDCNYDKEFIKFIDKTKYEINFESLEKLAKRVVRKNNDYLTKEFLERYKKNYYLMIPVYNYLIKNKKYELLIVENKMQYKFIASILKDEDNIEKIINENNYLDFSVKKVIELYYEINKFTKEDYEKIRYILNNIQVKNLLYKLYIKKEEKIPIKLEKFYLKNEIYNF